MTRFLLLMLLMGCGSEPASGPPPAQEAPPPSCAVEVRVTFEDAPLAAATIEGTAAVAVDDRTSRTVGRQSVRADAAGNARLELPCGADVVLRVGGWLWLNPQAIRAGDGGPVAMKVAPEKEGTLKAIADDGSPLTGRYVRARDGAEFPLPAEGLAVHGMEPVTVHGTVHIDGFPPRPWRLERSDFVEQDHSGEHDHSGHEVTLLFGDRQARWVLLGKAHKRVRGAWCVRDAARAEACKIEPLAIRCACPGPALVAGEGWDVALRVDLPLAENVVELPVIEERCLPGDRARPAGIDAGLVAEATYPPGGCIQVAAGQALDVRVDGVWARALTNSSDRAL